MPENVPAELARTAAILRRAAKSTENRIQDSNDRLVEGFDRLFILRDEVANRAALQHLSE